jgi:hypothetical protein
VELPSIHPDAETKVQAQDIVRIADALTDWYT